MFRFFRWLVAGALVCIGAASAAQTPDFVDDIMSFQVFPRQGDAGDIRFVALRPGRMSAQVFRDVDNLKVAEQVWDIGSSSQVVSIPKIPVGGEYTVRVNQGMSSAVFEHILVGEVWVIGGQSNAYGAPGPVNRSVIPQVHMMQGVVWKEGSDPFFNPILAKLEPGQSLTTPWIRAAQDYYSRTGIPVGLMGFCAPAKEMDFFMDPAHQEMKEFKPMVEKYGKGASVFCWYQGEADTTSERYPVYKSRLKAMAAALRRYSQNPQMRMVIIQLSYLIPHETPSTWGFGKIREAQRAFCVEDGNALLIPALPYEHRDPVNLSLQGVRSLGARIAQALEESKNGAPVWQGPKVAFLRFTDASHRRIEIRFDNAKRLILTSDPNSSREAQETWRAQWFVTDPRHLGYAQALQPQIKDGIMTVQLIGAAAGPTSTDPTGQVLQVRLANTGFIKPMEVLVD